MTKKKGVAKNYVFNLIYQLLTVLLPLITTPYLSRVLQAEGIGIFGYTFSIVTYFILIGSLGISMYGQREIAYHQQDKEKYTKSFYEIFFLRLLFLTLSIILFFLFYGLSGEYIVYYRILIIQLVATIFDISWFFQGMETFDKTVLRNSIVKILSIILIFCLVKQPSDLWKYFVIYVGAELLGNLSFFFYLPKYLTKIKLNQLQIWKHFKPTLVLFLPQVAIQIYTVLDKTMLGILTKDMNEVGYYEQAQKIAKAVLVLTAALQTVMNSRIANAYSNKNKEEIKECLRISLNYIWFITLPVAFGLAAVAYKFVPWYYGSGYDRVTSILVATAPIAIIIGLSGVTGIQYLVQTGKQKAFTMSVVIGAIMNFLLNLILIPKFSGIGATIASIIAEFIILLYQLHYFKDIYKIGAILKMSWKCFISSILMYIIVRYISGFLSVSIFNTFIEVVIGMIFYIGILFILKYQFLMDILRQIKTTFDKIKIKKKCEV